MKIIWAMAICWLVSGCYVAPIGYGHGGGYGDGYSRSHEHQNQGWER